VVSVKDRLGSVTAEAVGLSSGECLPHDWTIPSDCSDLLSKIGGVVDWHGLFLSGNRVVGGGLIAAAAITK
jgi:hypothetical protein